MLKTPVIFLFVQYTHLARSLLHGSFESQFQGCFIDSRDRVLSDTVIRRHDNNIHACLEYCRNFRMTFAGLEYGHECFCGDNYDFGRLGRSALCIDPCSDSRFSNQTCGGHWAIQVYSVCPPGKYVGSDNKCSNSCHCHSNEVCKLTNGHCIDGVCKTGWKGSSCHLRDCSTSNGGCEQTCSDTEDNGCGCHLGYDVSQRNSSACVDINECNSNGGRGPCDHLCTNSVGSYECSCFDQFTKISQHNCEETCLSLFYLHASKDLEFSSDCNPVMVRENVSYKECVLEACTLDVNVIKFASTVCEMRKCVSMEIHDLKYITKRGGWNIYVMIDNERHMNTQSPRGSLNIGMIAGISVAVLVLIILLALLGVFIWKKVKQKRNTEENELDSTFHARGKNQDIKEQSMHGEPYPKSTGELKSVVGDVDEGQYEEIPGSGSGKSYENLETMTLVARKDNPYQDLK